MKMSAQNPLSGIQSVQQIPGGIPPAVAQYFQDLQTQQQQTPSQNLDPSQLGDYIKQLQENGASDNQIQQVIQKLQDNGGQMPQQTDTMQGGSGTDAISNGEYQNGGNSQSSAPVVSGGSDQSAQSPLSQNLNALAGGQGNVNYDVLGGSYPTPRPIPQLSQQDLLLQQLARPNTGGAGGGLAIAVQGAKAADIQQQIAQIAALNNRDVAAHGELMAAAKESGITQNQARQLTSEDALRKAQAIEAKAHAGEQTAQAGYLTDTKGHRWQIDKNRVGPNGEPILINEATGETKLSPVNSTGAGGANNIRRLPEGTQNSIYTEIERQTGMLGANGKPKDDAPNPLVDTQRAQISDDVVRQLQTSPDISIPGAVTRALNKMGGVKSLREQTTPGFFSANSTGFREFTPQTAPNVATATPIGVPAISSTPVEAIQNGGSVSTPSDGAGISLARPKTKADLDALPSGTKYVNPANHSVYIKP